MKYLGTKSGNMAYVLQRKSLMCEQIYYLYFQYKSKA